MKQFLAQKYRNFKVLHNMKFVNKEGVIDLSIGDSDLHTDLEVVEKTFQDVKNGHTHYANPYGLTELRQALCDTFYEDHQLSYAIEECLVTTSGNHALWLALHAIIDVGDEVLILEPYYPFYPQQVRAAGGVPVCVPMAGSSNFSLNVAAVRAKLTPKTKAIILNSPNNPTGSCYSKQELQELAQLVLAYNLVVISDEVYTNFCYENEHVSFAAIAGMRQHTITIGSFSKNYVMTGWRVGFIFTSPDLVYIMKEINENNVFTSPTVSQRASIHALAARKRIQQYLYTEFKTRLFYLYQELSLVKGFKPIKPQGAIYLFIDVSATQKTGIEIAEFLFAQANVAVIPGCSYGESTGNYIRITASKKIEELQLAVARIKAAIGQL